MSAMIAGLAPADQALLISLASLGVALMALGFQLWNALRLDRASLKVTLAAMDIVEAGSPAVSVIAVTVVNSGKRPTKLTSLWLTFRRDRWSHRKLVPRRWRQHVALMTLTEIPGVPEPQLPQVLDVGAEVTVLYPTGVVRQKADEGGWRYCVGAAEASTATRQTRLISVGKLVAK